VKLGEIIVVDGKPYEAVMAGADGACGDCPFLGVVPCPDPICWDGDTDFKFKMLPMDA